MQLDNLNFDLNELTLDTVINWPVSVRRAAIAFCSLLLFGIGFWFDTRGQLSELNDAQSQETTLRQQFEFKQQQAASYKAYQIQVKELRQIFSDLLKQLPSSTEVPGLLEDISRQGLESGLTFHLIEPQPEVPKQFYVELPIQIEVFGTYHQIATFISKVANLSRIVTLNDFSLIRTDSENQAKDSTDSHYSDADPKLHFKVIASTYRYVEEMENDDEVQKHA